jgi:hypothetical protein
VQRLQRIVAQVDCPNRIRCCCHDKPPALRSA